MSAIVQHLQRAGVPEAQIDRLLDQWGGLPIYVPRAPAADHPLVVIAGAEAAAALAAAYGGERILMPLGARRRRDELARRVRELRAAGLNNCEIARRLGIHLRSVQRLIRAHFDVAVRDERQTQLSLE